MNEDLEIAGSVVTLGNFDGIHLGHQALIGGAVGDARRLGLPSIVLTFRAASIKSFGACSGSQNCFWLIRTRFNCCNTWVSKSSQCSSLTLLLPG